MILFNFVGQVAAVESTIPVAQPKSLSSISASNDLVSIPIISSLVTPPEWLLTTAALSASSRDWHSNEQGYIFYTHSWQPDADKIAHKAIGEHITLHFQTGRPKQFIVENLFSVGPKSADRSELARQSGTMLIYSSTGYTDRDRLVILAKELPTSEVSSL